VYRANIPSKPETLNLRSGIDYLYYIFLDGDADLVEFIDYGKNTGATLEHLNPKP
jgi:hypothetical protein